MFAENLDGKLQVDCVVLCTSCTEGTLGFPSTGGQPVAPTGANPPQLLNDCKAYLNSLFSNPGLCL